MEAANPTLPLQFYSKQNVRHQHEDAVALSKTRNNYKIKLRLSLTPTSPSPILFVRRRVVRHDLECTVGNY
jgi:hypothetical protein